MYEYFDERHSCSARCSGAGVVDFVAAYSTSDAKSTLTRGILFFLGLWIVIGCIAPSRMWLIGNKNRSNGLCSEKEIEFFCFSDLPLRSITA